MPRFRQTESPPNTAAAAAWVGAKRRKDSATYEVEDSDDEMDGAGVAGESAAKRCRLNRALVHGTGAHSALDAALPAASFSRGIEGTLQGRVPSPPSPFSNGDGLLGLAITEEASRRPDSAILVNQASVATLSESSSVSGLSLALGLSGGSHRSPFSVGEASLLPIAAAHGAGVPLSAIAAPEPAASPSVVTAIIRPGVFRPVVSTRLAVPPSPVAAATAIAATAIAATAIAATAIAATASVCTAPAPRF